MQLLVKRRSRNWVGTPKRTIPIVFRVSICLYTLWNSRLFLAVALLSCCCYLVLVSLESLQSTLRIVLFELPRFRLVDFQLPLELEDDAPGTIHPDVP